MDGSKRPIAIACTEDKIVEKVLANLLTAIYENVFLKCSYGFRPNLSCHHAVSETHKILESKQGYDYVVEIDLAKFFNTVNHRHLMKLLSKRIGSKKTLYQLKIIEETTRIVNISKDSYEVFDFLGFTFLPRTKKKIQRQTSCSENQQEEAL